MAVTILERPNGHILGTCVEGAVIDDNGGGGEFRVVSISHGFSTGDYIYIYSDVENYNGFWYVDVQGVNTFLIRPYAGGDYVEYISGSSVNYCPAILTHGWSCVHLPITYRLSTNLYPTNSSDTTRNINSVQDTNGWTVLQLSGSLGTVHTYDFVKVTAPNDTELSKVYQILEWISDTVMIINLEYDSSNNFTSATALKHYNNYNIIVRVYAGINSSHQWTAQKPYELAATLQFIPDDNNEAFFSINELLKSYIQTRNNLILGTLPNNIDFWTNFYIEVAESYDDSDGYVFGTTTSSYTSDQSTFEGTAVNAKLEFKNQYSGYLSEYLMSNANTTGKFLTLFDRPVIFQCGVDTPDCYSDISFLNPYNGTPLTLRKQFYLNGNLGTTVNTSLGTPDSGVIRAELEVDCNYDRVDISVVNIIALASLASWLEHVSGTRQWTIDAAPDVSLLSATSSYFLYTPLAGLVGESYTINYNFTNSSGADADVTVDIGFLDASFVVVVSDQLDFTSGGTISGSVVLSPLTQGVYLYIKAAQTDVGATTVTVNSISVSAEDVVLSETKELKINCDCCKHEIRLSWLNNLAGMEPTWVFCAEKDVVTEIQEAMTTKKNILPTWPKSYGADADTIKKQTLRISNKSYTVRSQFLTQDEVDAISYIKSSILVQIINSRTDRRTVIVDTDSFIVRKDGDKTHEIAFNISFTDDIPVQTT